MGQRIVIINRWSDDFSSYEKSIDHLKHHVCYIANENGRKGIRAKADLIEEIVEVNRTNDIEELRQAALQIQEKHGKIDKILALSEFDLKEAAELRTFLGVEGVQADQVLLYKDKVAMKQRILERGLRAPEYVGEMSESAVQEFVARLGYPLIVKPKTGAASQGVYLIENEETWLQVLPQISLEEYECEEYVQGPIFHVDGLIRQGEVVYIQPSAYINTCLAFNHGTPLGSVFVDEPMLKQQLIDFTLQVLEALELSNGAFHLEIILKNGTEPVFLEIGARVGGGEIPFLMKELYGIDLMDEWIKIELELPSETKWPGDELCGGFLMVPEPQERPCRVVEAPSMVGLIPTLIKETLPNPGDVLDGEGGYEEISGRFLYRGQTAEQVRQDIIRTIETYRLDAEPLDLVR